MDMHQHLSAVLAMAAAMLGGPAGQAEDAKTAAEAAQTAAESAQGKAEAAQTAAEGAQAAAETALSNMTVADVDVSGATPVITGEANKRYICGTVTTISFTPSVAGICEVVFSSGTTAAVLTVPNTVKWPSWFDPTSLSANCMYEISVRDGELGTVMVWA